jgi:hypothetical protein
MDEEDLAEMRDDQKLVDLNDEMDVSGPSGRNKDEDECDVFLLLLCLLMTFGNSFRTALFTDPL